MMRIFKSLLTAGPTSRRPVKSHLSLTTLEAREVPAMLNAWTNGIRLVGPEVSAQPTVVRSMPAVARPAVGTTSVDASIKGGMPIAVAVPNEAAERSAFASVAKSAVAGLTQTTGMTATLTRLGSIGLDTSGLVPGGASRLRSDPAKGLGGTPALGAKAHDLGMGFDPSRSILQSKAANDARPQNPMTVRNSLISEPTAQQTVVSFWGDLFNETNQNHGALATTYLVLTLWPAVVIGRLKTSH